MLVREHRTRRLGAALILGALGAILFAACGRTELPVPDPLPATPECFVDDDCPAIADRCSPVVCELVPGMIGGGGLCVAQDPVDCDDDDVCTDDMCNPETGACEHTSAALDLDGDGYLGPISGQTAGASGACGDDCDDSNPSAFPGGLEVCDGVDNDCNGIIDDNASFIPLQDEPTRISGDVAPTAPGGLAYSGSSYAAIYSGSTNGFHVYQSMLTDQGQPIDPGEHLLTEVSGDSGGGPIVWVGDRYGVAWSDRRDGDYETYFSVLKEDGKKTLPDVRLSFAPGFSINAALAFDGKSFIVAWQDDRYGPFDVYAQRVSIDGVPIGDNVQLTDDGPGNESPSIAVGDTTVGVAWSGGNAVERFIQFRTYDGDLAPSSSLIRVTTGQTEAVYPTLVWNKAHDGQPGSYVLAWFDRTANPKAIYATVLSEAGETLIPARAVTSPGAFRSRYPFMRPLGDRLLLVYSDDRDQNDGYELYARMISASLEPIGPEQRLTDAPKDSLYPVASFGPEGEVGILFRDDRSGGKHHEYFMRLGCVTAP